MKGKTRNLQAKDPKNGRLTDGGVEFNFEGAVTQNGRLFAAETTGAQVTPIPHTPKSQPQGG